MSNFGNGALEEHFFEIRPLASSEMLFKDFFNFLALAAILFSSADHLSNFGKGARGTFSDIILKTGPRLEEVI